MCFTIAVAGSSALACRFAVRRCSVRRVHYCTLCRCHDSCRVRIIIATVTNYTLAIWLLSGIALDAYWTHVLSPIELLLAMPLPTCYSARHRPYQYLYSLLASLAILHFGAPKTNKHKKHKKLTHSKPILYFWAPQPASTPSHNMMTGGAVISKTPELAEKVASAKEMGLGNRQ